MSRRYCSLCPTLRRQVGANAELPWCKRRRLCSVVDPALILRYPNESLQSYRVRARAIELGHVAAVLAILGLQFPTSGRELASAALQLHETLFAGGDPSIAGRFRETPIWFGRGGNQVEGVRPDDIVRELHAFPMRVMPTTRVQAARWGADFLHRFFAIHPFTDGNGRLDVGGRELGGACANRRGKRRQEVPLRA